MESGDRTWLREDDLALIDSLHANGRATFEQRGQALGTAPTTVARRWRRLVRDGEAWVSSMPGPYLRLGP